MCSQVIASFPMAGTIPADAVMHDRLQALGYVEVETVGPSILGATGLRFRGHQFRYSELSPPPDPSTVETAYTVRKRRGNDTTREGYRTRNVVASYVHAHWASNPQIAAAFVASCVRFREARA